MKERVIKVKADIGDFVYLETDVEEGDIGASKELIVIGLRIENDIETGKERVLYKLFSVHRYLQCDWYGEDSLYTKEEAKEIAIERLKKKLAKLEK